MQTALEAVELRRSSDDVAALYETRLLNESSHVESGERIHFLEGGGAVEEMFIYDVVLQFGIMSQDVCVALVDHCEHLMSIRLSLDNGTHAMIINVRSLICS